MKERRKVDIMYVDETRWKRSKARSTVVVIWQNIIKLN